MGGGGYPTRRLSAPPPPRPPHRAFLLVLPLALIELVGSLVVRARVPEASDWEQAAAWVAASWAEGDAVVPAPRWTEPLLRESLGRAMPDRFDLARAGETGLEGHPRLFVVSERGHTAFAGSDADADVRSRALLETAVREDERTFGRVRVERLRLATGPLLYDFVERLGEASVALGERDCPRTTGRGSGRGLGEGPVLSPDRFSCGGDDRSVGTTVIEDLEFAPRHCVWHRPVSPGLSVTYAGVPLGAELVLHAGVHWVSERSRDGAPVTLRVREGSTVLGELVHEDGDGWATSVIAIDAARRGTTATLTFEVTSDAPGRPFCWSARSIGGVP